MKRLIAIALAVVATPVFAGPPQPFDRLNVSGPPLTKQPPAEIQAVPAYVPSRPGTTGPAVTQTYSGSSTVQTNSSSQRGGSARPDWVTSMTDSSYNYCEQYYEVDRQMSKTYDDLWSAQTTNPSFVAKQAADGAAIYMEVWETGRKVLEQMNRAISQGAVTAADMDEAIYKVSQCMRYAEKSAGSYRFLSDSAAQRR